MCQQKPKLVLIGVCFTKRKKIVRLAYKFLNKIRAVKKLAAPHLPCLRCRKESYNIQRTHQGKMCCGRTPMETLEDGMKFWQDKKLSQI